jgi:ribosomal protein S12 methylthiotransferase accessory factor
MRAWAALDHAAFLDVIRDPVLAVRERIALSSLPTAAPGTADDPAALLALVAGRLAGEGLPIIVVDFTGPGDPARVVKVIVPGLEVETMTYDRIGPRNLRRLLARASTSPAPASPRRAPSACRCGPGRGAPGRPPLVLARGCQLGAARPLPALPRAQPPRGWRWRTSGRRPVSGLRYAYGHAWTPLLEPLASR